MRLDRILLRGKEGSVMRKVLMAATAAAALGIAGPAIAAVSVAEDPTGTPLSYKIYGIMSTGNPVFGSSPDNTNVPNVTYTADAVTDMEIKNGFAAIDDHLPKAPSWTELIINPDLLFSKMEFALQLTAAGSFQVFYLLANSGMDANDPNNYTMLADSTPNPITQTADDDKNYLIGGDSGEQFDGIMIKVTGADIFEFKQNSYDPAPGAVPEPGTWALMLLGFGGIGMALRRSRKVKPALMQIA
jgi:hypothetical protein